MNRLTIIIVTHNRAATLASTLDRLVENPTLPHDSMQIIVIDNGSIDDTTPMLQARTDLPIQIITRPQNEGVSARNYGFAQANSQYILLIDDDSYPVGDAVTRSLTYLDQNPQTAAVVGQVRLLNGQTEASALPAIMANGAVCLRKKVIDEVGGLPREFFRQAEEYDQSFRIWNAGYQIARFEDLIYIHEKVPGNRQPKIIHRYDLRNNLILIERYLPRAFRAAYRADWIQRYSAFARNENCQSSIRRARLDGLLWRCREKFNGRRTLSPQAFDNIFQHHSQTSQIKTWAHTHQIHNVTIADFSKNIYATYQACKKNHLQISSIYDPNPAFQNTKYRGAPIVDSIPQTVDGIILSNINPAQINPRLRALKEEFHGPILQLWQGDNVPTPKAVNTQPLVITKRHAETISA